MDPNRKERLTAFKRAGILEAAPTLFVPKGVAATTMDDIAKAADYSNTTIYAYFKNKDDILNHLIHEGMDRLLADTREISRNHPRLADFHREFCRHVARMHATRPVYFAGITSHIPCSPEEREQDGILHEIYEKGEAINSIMECRLKQAVDQGEIPPVASLKDVIMVMWFSVLGLVEKTTPKKEYIAMRLGKSPQEFLDYSFAMLFNLVLKRHAE